MTLNELDKMTKELRDEVARNSDAASAFREWSTMTIPHKCSKCAETVDSSVAFTHMRECKGEQIA
jgi:hypothetical protein